LEKRKKVRIFKEELVTDLDKIIANIDVLQKKAKAMVDSIQELVKEAKEKDPVYSL
jgi:uncharacterized coiled-coil DUF342 family protein